MLEIGIIVTIALILFLLLRNYPKTALGGEASKSDFLVEKNSGKMKPMTSFFSKLIDRRREKAEEEIKQAIVSDQDDLVSPKEIEDAKKSFYTKDSEIAKILHEADEALKAGDLRFAEDKSIEALARDKRCDQAYVFIAEVAMRKDNIEDAIEACKTALKCNRDNGFAHAILGEAYYKNEKYSEAIEHYQRAVNIDRNLAAWQAGLGKAYLEVRQYSKASKALRRASSLDIDNKEYKKLAGEAEDKQRSHFGIRR